MKTLEEKMQEIENLQEQAHRLLYHKNIFWKWLNWGKINRLHNLASDKLLALIEFQNDGSVSMEDANYIYLKGIVKK